MVDHKPLLRWLIFGVLALCLTTAGMQAPVVRAQPPIQCPPDDIGPGISEPPGCNRFPLVSPDNFCLALTAAPNAGVQPGNLVTYTATLAVVGNDRDEQVTLRLPIAPDLQEVVDIRSSRPSAWVSAILTDTVEIQLGGVKPGDLITTTLRTRIYSTAPIGTDLSARATLNWRNANAGTVRASNRIALAVAPRDISAAPALTIEATAESLKITAQSFAPREIVALWYDKPDGETLELGRAMTDNDGMLAVEADNKTEEPGRYQVVAYGLCSKQTATAVLER
jgi:hypothetical protein